MTDFEERRRSEILFYNIFDEKNEYDSLKMKTMSKSNKVSPKYAARPKTNMTHGRPYNI